MSDVTKGLLSSMGTLDNMIGILDGSVPGGELKTVMFLDLFSSIAEVFEQVATGGLLADEVPTSLNISLNFSDLVDEEEDDEEDACYCDEEEDSDLIGPLPLSDEIWREYQWDNGRDGYSTTYRIDDPQFLYYRIDGSTHRIVDSLGIVHCLPAPGEKGCVLRWKPKSDRKPVAW